MDRQIILRDHMRKTCEESGETARTELSVNSFIFDPNHKLLLCRNAKVGTTTLLSHYLRLSKLVDSKTKRMWRESSRKLHDNVPKIFQITKENRNIRKLAESSVSISVVRHPFERLASAYRDKIESGVLKKASLMIEEDSGRVSFPNFVTFILNKARRTCRRVSSCNLDIHWVPMISRCGYCDLQYSAIARLESLAEDLRQIGVMAGLEFSHVLTHSHSSHWNSTSASLQYFSQVPKRDVEELYKLYKIDFDLFQYSLDLYLDASKKY